MWGAGVVGVTLSRGRSAWSRIGSHEYSRGTSPPVPSREYHSGDLENPGRPCRRRARSPTNRKVSGRLMTDSQLSSADSPERPSGSIDVKAPPDAVVAQDTSSVLATVLPLTGSMGVMVFMAVSNSNGNRTLFLGGGMVVAMLSMVGINIYRQVRQHRESVKDQRREYLAYLSELRNSVRTMAGKQRRHAVHVLPEPEALPYFVKDGRRVWERGAGDDEMLVRLGRSTQPLSVDLVPEKLDALAKPDPVCLSAMSRFVATHRDVDGLPLGTSLRYYSRVEVVGEAEATRALTRALLVHLMSMTPPSRLRVAVVASGETLEQWEWLKWAPHAWSDSAEDDAGPARMIGLSWEEVAGLLPEGLENRGAFSSNATDAPVPSIVVVVDGGWVPPRSPIGSSGGLNGVTVIDLPERWGPLTSLSTLRVLLHPASTLTHATPMEVVRAGEDPALAVADTMDIATAEAVVRHLSARFGVSGETAVSSAPVGTPDPKRSADLLNLLELGDVRDFNPDSDWRRRSGRDRLRVPFAVTPEGAPVVLDIKESAESGMGPHGLLVGATGSGKSEVLRTLVLALALTHPPDQLNFVLVDFKGGATFAGMSELPHVSAMISNLESELGLVDRMEEALRGEMTRRQEILRDAGNYANVTDYEEARRAGKHNGEPLPALFVILDEFSELLSAKPDFIEVFVAIGRLGRSMQIHLLLSSQRLEEGRLHGLESHLSYRIGLRTFSAAESRIVLGVADAYDLPPYPGSGYLKSGTRDMTRFRSCYVAGPPPTRAALTAAPAAAAAARDSAERARAPRVVPFSALPVRGQAAPPPVEEEEEVVLEPAAESAQPSLPQDAEYAEMATMDIAVARMAGHGTPAHQIWLPPLEVSETFDSLLGDLGVDPKLGLVSPSWRARGDLVVPMGITDVPLEQRRELYSVDLSGSGGHVAVIGGPLSGKSTALRSLVMGLALTRTPTEVQIYVIDLGGGTFATMLDLPHLAGVATRDEPDIVARIMAEVSALLDDRERFFKANRIDSIQTYRRERAAGRIDDGYGDVFLIVDGWSTLKTDFEQVTDKLMAIAPRALALGVHIVVATGRWTDMRMTIKDMFATRIELRLGDPTDSEINRKIAREVPTGRPGRGLDPKARHMLLATPRTDGDHDPSTLASGVNNACRTIAEAWTGPQGPKLRLLPTRIDLTTLQEQVPPGGDPVIGINEARLEPVRLDMSHDPHLLVLGDAKTGKSAFLRALGNELCRGHSTDEVRMVAIDLRRSLLGELPSEHLLTYVTVREEAAREANDLANFLRARMPGPDVTPEQLRRRSWWHGPDVYVLVDDYDLLSSGQQTANPLLPLQPLLAQSQDLGLHLILTRRIGGASRAMFEPITQTLNDLSTPGIMLPGSPDEGPLLGRQKPIPGPPGRARLISRDHGVQALQLAWAPPTQ